MADFTEMSSGCEPSVRLANIRINDFSMLYKKNIRIEIC